MPMLLVQPRLSFPVSPFVFTVYKKSKEAQLPAPVLFAFKEEGRAVEHRGTVVTDTARPATVLAVLQDCPLHITCIPGLPV